MTASLADPRPFIEHMSLATAWLRSNGRTVTELAVTRVMAKFTVDQLQRAMGPAASELAR